MSIDIGYVRKCESWKLSSRFFPSKIGGLPAWLDLETIPRADVVTCKNCQKPCIFLCQIYAPYDDNTTAFHRTLFLFICRDFDCCKNNNNDNLRILRSQLPRSNSFYPYEPPVDDENWQKTIDALNYGSVCRVCYLKAPSRCGSCKKVYYCSRYHQLVDWKAGHKEKCCTYADATQIDTTISNLLFSEYEIVIESEDFEDDENDSEDNELEKEEHEIEKFKLMVNNGQAGSLADVKDEDLMKMSHNDEDETFFEFHQVVKKNPDQILRYHRGASPLYISSKNQPVDIPKCENCGGERQFEFQVMPQLLNYLNFNDVIRSLDWGILAIFTCKNSCTITSGYCEEFIFKQDIV